MNTRPLRRTPAPRTIIIFVVTLCIFSLTIFAAHHGTHAFATPNSPAIAAGQFQFEAATYSQLEGTTLTFIIRRTGGNEGAASINVSVTGGTATADTDYRFDASSDFAQTSPTSGTLTSRNGTNGGFITLIFPRDDIPEPDETIELTLSDPTGGATLGAQTTTVITIQNESRPLITSELPYVKSVVEGNDGTTEVSFPVNLSAPSDQVVTMEYVFKDVSSGSTAKPGIDFSPASGTLIFAPGETRKSVPVSILGDTLDENNEYVIFKGVSATNAIPNGVENQVFITDDDPPPTVSISDASVIEGTGSISSLRFTVTASAPTDVQFPGDVPTVILEFVDGTAIGVRNGNYQRNNIVDFYPDPQTIRLNFFGREQTSLTYSLSIASDSFDEPDETLLARIRSSYFSIGDGEATGTIIDDDSPSDILISEFWLRNGRNISNEFVELYNNTDRPFNINATDGSSGWTLISDITSSRSTSDIPRFQTHFTIPNGTVIPPRGHYLIVHTPDPNLGTPLAPDGTYTHGILSNKGIALLSIAKQGNILNFVDEKFVVDAVGFANSDLREGGTGLSSIPDDMPGEHSFVRRFVNGKPQDTTDNAADFVLVSTTGGMFGSIQSVLGAPGAENLSSPVANVPPVVRVEPLDRRVSIENSPNLVRDATPVVNGSRGTIVMRRTLINDGDAPLTQLRFRIVNLPTLGSSDTNASATQADLRALSSSDARVTLSDGSVVEVVGLTLEEPSQPLGGGLNSTLAVGAITMASPLKAGASVNVELRFGVERAGRYRVGLSLERDAHISGRRSMRGRTRSVSQAR